MSAFGARFTPDADFVNVQAKYFRGRQEIYDHHAPPHTGGWMKQSTIVNTIDRVHLVSPTVAVAQSTWTMKMNGWLGRLRPRTGHISMVLQKIDGEWLIVSAQNTGAALVFGDPMDWLLLALVGGVGGALAALRFARGSRRAEVAIGGAVAGMFVLAVPAALVFFDDPMLGGAIGFGALGTLAGALVCGSAQLMPRRQPEHLRA